MNIKFSYALLLSLCLSNFILFGQAKKDSCCLSKSDLVGVWQRDNELVGSGLAQNFEFYDNNTFVLNLSSMSDDLRDIIQVKGKYRLAEDKMYFTFTSRVIREGKIELTDGGISLNLFEIKSTKVKEIPEPNPKELVDPCYITLISNKQIKLSNEVYFKVKVQ
ncbi:MAG: hypothetical protein ACHQRM_00160 [Bacteroidia bacterium]